MAFPRVPAVLLGGLLLLVAGTRLCAAAAATPANPAQFRVPVLDLDAESGRQVVVDREPGQYLGHPTTVLLEDDRTMLCVYPKGHGQGGIVYQRSVDAGRTWSGRLPTPANWATSKEVPTIHRVVDAAGRKRLILWSGLHPARLAVSEDDGQQWSELKPAGDWGGIVVMGSVEAVRPGPGHYLALFHDDGRFLSRPAAPKNPVEFKLLKTWSKDGGLTWSQPEVILAASDVHLCEPGLIRSPDGKQLAVLLRENRRAKNSHLILSDDEGRTWSAPRELPPELTGDRHTGKYTPDGRLFISFRDISPRGRQSPTEGDWVAWVGRYEDLVAGAPGQYRVRLKDNHKGADCAYPGVEVLRDGTIVTTTYGHWTPNEAPYILSVRLHLDELDARARVAVASPARFRVVGDWEMEVTVPGAATPPARLSVSPPDWTTVAAERHESLPLFNPKAAGWVKGTALRGVKTQETTATGLLDPASVVVRSGPDAAAVTFQAGKDYELDPTWGTIGRLAGGGIGEKQPVVVAYRHALCRLDAVVLTAAGNVELHPGAPHAAIPQVPRIPVGGRHLGNLWLPGRPAKLLPEHLFPRLETAYPEAPARTPSPAETLTPKTLAKLRSGEPLRILAWGDSVTVGTYLPNPAQDRWQEQFVTRLKARFPRARIELLTEAWGGRNTAAYLAQPPGSEHNYREKVLGARPDLVVSEFVNDAGLKPDQVGERYGKLLADFRGIGAEWIILTPHYVRPDWMGLNREREIDEDPRPYVAGLRQFAAGQPVALADAARRYGRLWRQGLPHTTLLMNAINHPDPRGMTLFADALMELFPAR